MVPTSSVHPSSAAAKIAAVSRGSIGKVDMRLPLKVNWSSREMAPNNLSCLSADFMSSLPGESMKSKARISVMPMDNMVRTTEHKLLLWISGTVDSSRASNWLAVTSLIGQVQVI